MTSKCPEAVSLGKRRAATMTTTSRRENAAKGWQKRLGPDHLTADQRAILARLGRPGVAVARMARDDSGRLTPHGNRVASAVLALVGSEKIVVISHLTPWEVSYRRGPKYPKATPENKSHD